MIAILAIARTTMLELRRQRLLLVPVLLFVLSLVLVLSTFLLNDPGLDARDGEMVAWSLGMAAGVAGAVYATIVGASLIARELVGGTLLMLAARPIGRWQVVVGRWTGAAAFLLLVLAAACVLYGLTVCVLAGSLAPLDDPLRSLEVGAPATLLGLAIGTAFSVQGRTTAAIGSAIGITLFAWVAAQYTSGWMREQHLRDHLVPEVREQLDDDGRIIGPISTAVARLMPFGTLQARFQRRLEDRDATYAGPGQSEDGSIDVVDQGGFGTAMVVPGPDGEAQQATLPPVSDAIECARFSGATCLFGYEEAWTKRRIPAPDRLDERLGFAFALLAIPAWLGVAVLLLHRRRDLVS